MVTPAAPATPGGNAKPHATTGELPRRPDLLAERERYPDAVLESLTALATSDLASDTGRLAPFRRSMTR
jgi:hypothetical protein